MPEWLKGADCKSAAFRYVGSNPTRPNEIYLYIPIIFIRIKDNNPNINKIPNTKSIRNLGLLKKFLKGVIITKIKPRKLLMKNRGYLKMFVQKLFIC